MRRRYPQQVRAGDLVGLPVLDWNDATIGFVRDVVRTHDGALKLVVPYSARFGWTRLPMPWFPKRLIAVPIEKVAILARQIAALEMSREDFDAAPTWSETQAEAVIASELIRIAITRR
ncbi:hypothetical protein [Variibacter gotjawalensis]|nr:hypothetical protein [Variibacter gotjawalensis]NIK48893.1 hypothetical protein [Variibacter gotjawalensis]